MRALAVSLLVALVTSSPRAAAETAEEITLVGGFARPEDLELVPEARALLVSEMGFGAPLSGGGIAAVVWSQENGPTGPPRRLWPSDDALAPKPSLGDPNCTSPPDPAFFSGHGLSVSTRGTQSPTVAVVGHGAREAIEYFELHGAGSHLRARWVGCVELPPNTAGNDVALQADGAILVTNYIPTVHGLRAWVWLQLANLGWNTGSVLSWRPQVGWSELADSRGPMPNGILRLGPRVYVAYNGGSRIEALPVDELEHASKITLDLPGAPDNLSAGPDGRILAAVLRSTPAEGWSIVSVDPDLSGFEIIFTHEGTRLTSVTSVVFDGSRFLLGSMGGGSIGVLQRGAATATTPLRPIDP